MQINIKATNAKLTPESHEIINDKISSLSKYFENIISADVEIGLSSMHHNKGNIYKTIVNLSVPKTILRASAETDDIIKSMNQVNEKLKILLKKYKETHK
ncbi:ribosome-associated translation inhibitor RaiA [Candidatus Falkowbacteria bacterium]|uniref:Ribosomal subunit interface protein n=1 Tax=Candidatus Buchananbacteria bacterium CG10_big_fil_rev_8_21_14_0_10_33_19 TaxID=1974525 RepID=A0A2H0W476_9BACT|nr:ribosome-associated translation inhibitor RaiA [Candidatus Falkowbacteria bacterium]PIS06158.1 MAG: ribosomal subunit interface protein [Candidatus Buchananbacteria bacterium CG10_big_fil_rev_8_21_14_0_10_33_19]